MGPKGFCDGYFLVNGREIDERRYRKETKKGRGDGMKPVILD